MPRGASSLTTLTEINWIIAAPTLDFVRISQNRANSGAHRDSGTGIKGVYWSKSIGKYVAHIMVNRKATHLGVFTNKKMAGKAYRRAELQNFKEFAHKSRRSTSPA